MEKQQLIKQAFNKFEAEINKGLQLAPILGSCQYKTIEDTHQLVTTLLKVMGQQEFEKVFGIKYRELLTMKQIEGRCYGILVDEICYSEDLETPTSKHPRYKNKFNHEHKRLPLKTYIKITKDESWDLWSAEMGPLTQLEFTDSLDLHIYGPIFNAHAQGDNFNIGVQLAYLTHFHNIPLDAWADYST